MPDDDPGNQTVFGFVVVVVVRTKRERSFRGRLLVVFRLFAPLLGGKEEPTRDDRHERARGFARALQRRFPRTRRAAGQLHGEQLGSVRLTPAQQRRRNRSYSAVDARALAREDVLGVSGVWPTQHARLRDGRFERTRKSGFVARLGHRRVGALEPREPPSERGLVRFGEARAVRANAGATTRLGGRGSRLRLLSPRKRLIVRRRRLSRGIPKGLDLRLRPDPVADLVARSAVRADRAVVLAYARLRPRPRRLLRRRRRLGAVLRENLQQVHAAHERVVVRVAGGVETRGRVGRGHARLGRDKSASRFACVPSVVTGRGARVGVGSRGAPRLGKDDRKRPSGRVERFGSLAAVDALSRSSSGNRETERTRNQRNERTKGAFDPQVDDPTETPATFDRSPLSSKISPNVGEDRNGLHDGLHDEMRFSG